MANGAYLQVRMDPSIKEQAKDILDQLGMSMSDAVGVYFRQIIRTKSIPFELKVSTLQAIDEIESGKGAVFDTTDELFEDLDN
jgi:DNA-damage-inducible protein J